MKALKKSSYVLLALLITLSVLCTGCSKDKKEKASSDNRKFCMWEVTSKNSKGKLYLFGTIHIGDKSMYPLPPKVTKAYKECNCIAVEVNVETTDDTVGSTSGASYADGSKITDHIDKAVYDNMKKILVENHEYAPAYENMEPHVWISAIDKIVNEKLPLSRTYGLDNHLIQQAKKDDKEILEVETIDMQNHFYSKISANYDKAVIKSYADYSVDAAVKSQMDLYKSLQDGTLDKLYNNDGSNDDSNLTAEDKEGYESFNKVMLTDRNVNMVEKAEQYLKENRKCFYAVGAAHMYGSDGLVEMLKAKGYTVKRV